VVKWRSDLAQSANVLPQTIGAGRRVRTAGTVRRRLRPFLPGSSVRRLLPLLLILALVPLSPPRQARAAGTVWTVSTTKDTTTPASSHCAGSSCPTLRDALVAAHSGDTITLAGLSGVITSTSTLSVTTNLTMTGPLTHTLALSGNGTHTVLTVSSGVTATISGLTMQDGLGSLTSKHGTIGAGGGIYNQGNLTLAKVVITGNSGTGGGGIFSDGAITGTAALTLTSSSVTNNVTGPAGMGGGVLADGYHGKSTLTISGTTILSNTAGVDGGGLWSNGDTTVISSTVGFNRTGISSLIVGSRDVPYVDETYATHYVGSGGGIYSTGPLTLTTTSVDHNRVAGGNVLGNDYFGADWGRAGGIYSSAPLRVTSSTVSSNDVEGYGGGIWSDAPAVITASAILSNTTHPPNQLISMRNTGDDPGGAGIGTSAPLTVTDSTLAGNYAYPSLYVVSDVQQPTSSYFSGGAIFAVTESAPVWLIASTVAYNHGLGTLAGLGPYTMTNTVLLGSCDVAALPTITVLHPSFHDLIDLGGNDFGVVEACIQSPSLATSAVQQSLLPQGTSIQTFGLPIVGTLGNYGGPTQTIALLSDDPARGLGVGPGCTANGGKDQRGSPRPATACDSGAWQH
jgi:hypothetical protein